MSTSITATNTNTAPAAPAGGQYDFPALLKMRQELLQHLQSSKHAVGIVASLRSKIEDLRKHDLASDLMPEGHKLVTQELQKFVAEVDSLQNKFPPFIKFQREKLMKVHAALRCRAPAARQAAAQQQTPRRVRLQPAPASQDYYVICKISPSELRLTVLNLSLIHI